MNNNQNNELNRQNLENKDFLENAKKVPQESVDFVLPQNREKKRHYKTHSKNMTFEEKQAESLDFIFATPHNKKKKRKKKALKSFGIVMSVIASILVLCVLTLFIFNQIGKSAMHNYEDMTIEPSPDIASLESVEDQGKTIIYNNHTYKFNEKVASVVLMGIDTRDPQYVPSVVGTGGQADAIYIAVMDTSNKKVTILGVSRDTMVDVNVYNESGGFVNTDSMQICLSYAYGDSKHSSCENTITSLERLFYGIQFDTYFSLNIPAIETLNDAVGGVTVTTESEFYSHSENRTISAGETTTLYGRDASQFLRTRDIEELKSNSDRMSRHITYMTAFLSQVWSSVKSDPTTVVDLYNTVDDNSTTNLTPAKMTYLASTAISGIDSYKEIEFINVPGSIKKGEYAEFYADEDGLMELILDTFYIQVA
ncbi:MAG: LytR family transcriptional regulator [Ruminococcaceae bacterium]|nr:LytR family transcriptional regulator [Oscillospiraceae bacterium]